jgi:hypothetical protein
MVEIVFVRTLERFDRVFGAGRPARDVARRVPDRGDVIHPQAGGGQLLSLAAEPRRAGMHAVSQVVNTERGELRNHRREIARVRRAVRTEMHVDADRIHEGAGRARHLRNDLRDLREQVRGTAMDVGARVRRKRRRRRRRATAGGCQDRESGEAGRGNEPREGSTHVRCSERKVVPSRFFGCRACP